MTRLSESFLKTISNRRYVVTSVINRGYANDSTDKLVSLYGANGSPYTRFVILFR